LLAKTAEPNAHLPDVRRDGTDRAPLPPYVKTNSTELYAEVNYVGGIWD
jgi:hypothetical protein